MKYQEKRNFLLIVSLALLVPLCAIAEDGKSKGAHAPDDRAHFAKKLDLNQDQQEALKSFRNERLEVMKLMQNLKGERMHLYALLKDPESEKSELLSQVGKVNTLQSEINTRKVKNLISLRETLEPKQLRMIMSKLRDKMQEHGGPPNGESAERDFKGRDGQFKRGGGQGDRPGARPNHRRPPAGDF